MNNGVRSLHGWIAVAGRAQEFRREHPMNEPIASSSSKTMIVIGEIAFQSNLLALSAAVESSRAAQAAVREIRKLAQHSTPEGVDPAPR